MTPQQLRLHKARKALSEAKCTCEDGPHDPYWVHCDKTVAEIELQEAAAAMGIVP